MTLALARPYPWCQFVQGRSSDGPGTVGSDGRSKPSSELNPNRDNRYHPHTSLEIALNLTSTLTLTLTLALTLTLTDHCRQPRPERRCRHDQAAGSGSMGCEMMRDDAR